MPIHKETLICKETPIYKEMPMHNEAWIHKEKFKEIEIEVSSDPEPQKEIKPIEKEKRLWSN